MSDMPGNQNIIKGDMNSVEDYSERLTVLLERMERLEASLRSLPLPNRIMDLCIKTKKMEMDKKTPDEPEEALKEENIADNNLEVEVKEHEEDKQEPKDDEMAKDIENSIHDS